MPSLGPHFVIDGPLPVALPHGLLQAAGPILEDFDLHMFNGVAVYPYPISKALSHNPRAAGTSREKDEGELGENPEFAAFTVYASIKCTARGIGSDEQFRDRARAVFEGTEGYAVELEFATADQVPDNPHLTDADAVVVGGGLQDPVAGLMILEKSIAATGRQGMIHADRGVVTAWIAADLISEASLLTQPLRTGLGTIVAAGAGYTDIFPESEAAPPETQGWAFATGPVQIRRSQVEIVPNTLREAMTRDTNDVVFRAERNYVVIWDKTLQDAVLVDGTP